MAKLELNALLAALQGTIGDLVFVREGDSMHVRRRARKGPAPSTSQLAQNSRFGVASRWARTLLTDPAMRAAYQRGCHGHLTPHNVAVSDFLNAPVIESIRLESYKGKPGDVIQLIAKDDFRIVRCTVQVRSVDGAILEEGEAERSALENTTWLYTSQIEIAPETTVLIEASAVDLPGNRATARAFYYVAA